MEKAGSSPVGSASLAGFAQRLRADGLHPSDRGSSPLPGTKIVDVAQW